MPEQDEMLTIRQVGVLFGGSGKPLDPSTIYRWIANGRLPKPVKLGSQMSRWRRSECQAALERMIAEPAK